MKIDDIIDEMETQIDNIKFYSGTRAPGALYTIEEGKRIVKESWIRLDELVKNYVMCRQT